MKFSKKLLSLLLCAVMVLGSVAIGGGGFAEVLDAFSVKASAASYSDGTGSNDGWADSTHIRFGSYPQTEVTDSSLISTLNSVGGTWKSYGYYSGTGGEYDGQMSSADYMMYCDVTVMNGSVPEKYRGVKFSTYRPSCTGHRSTTSADFICQYDNGYTVGNTYWFKYEPLVWRVLDSSTGLVMCESIIDSQAYNNYIWYGTGSKSTSSKYYGNESHTNYANDYYNSSIRKWLTEDFYATAFSESQQNNLLKYNCDNSCPWYSSFDSQNSSDKVFLLSYDEVKNTEYGFNSDEDEDDPARRAKGTDYAKCQGLWVYKNSGSNYDGNSEWWLRSPNRSSNSACGVGNNGCSYYMYDVDVTNGGVRPALKLNLLEIMKAEAKAELAEAKMNAVSDEAKAAIDTAIENVDKATNLDAVASAKAEGTRNAAEADEALADAIAEAKEALADAKEEATSDEAKAAIDEAIEALDNAKNLDAVAEEKAEALDDAAAADEALADAIEDAQEALEEAKAEATSDEAKAALDEAIEALNDATNLVAVAEEKAEALDDAAAADEALADAIEDAQEALEEAKAEAKSDKAKNILDEAIDALNDATSLDEVADEKAAAEEAAAAAEKELADAKEAAIAEIEEAAGDDCSAELKSVVNNGEKAVNNATSVEGVDEALANVLAAIKHQQQADGFRCPDEYHLLKYKGTVTLLAESKTDKVIYATSDPSVATVDENGKVTAVGKGKCVITASVEGTDISKDVEIEVKYSCCDIILYYILRIINFMKKIFNLIFAC